MSTIPRTPEEYRVWWSEQKPDIPYGYCWRGCGEKTKITAVDDRRWLHFKDEPIKYIYSHQARRGPVDYIIEDRGHGTQCWIWQRVTDRNGYGIKHVNHTNTTAHRFYYENSRGPIPEGLTLDHLCRVRGCVNPSHLEPVTQAVNNQRGSQYKLTQAKADEIRALHASGVSAKEIAPLFGIKRDSVYGVVNRRSWLG